MRRVLLLAVVASVAALVLMLAPGRNVERASAQQKPSDDASARADAPQTASLDVRVLEEHGAAIAGVTVTFDGLGTSHSATTDADGIARHRGLPPGLGALRASAPGRADAPARALQVAAGCTVDETLVLARAHPLRVRVVDRTGAPVAGVRVLAESWDDVPEREGVSGADGRCRIDGLSAGSVSIWSVPSPDETCSAYLPLDEEVTLVVPVSLVIAGIVRDHETGAPIADAAVGWTLAVTSGTPEFIARARTDADGHYVLPCASCPDLAHEPIEARAAGYRSGARTPLLPPLAAGGTWRADLVLAATGAIDLVVVDAYGRPLSAALEAAAGDEWQWLESDATGHVALEGFAAGNVRLRAPGADGERVAPATVRVPTRGRETVVVTVGSPRPLVDVRGRVVDARGAPVVGAVVHGAPSAPAATDADGRFALRIVEPETERGGASEITLRPRGGQASLHLVTRSAWRDTPDGAVLTLADPAQVTCRLLDTAGAPVSADVAVVQGRRVPVGSDGRVVADLRPGKGSIVVEHDGSTRFATEFDAAEGALVDLGDVVLAPLGRVAGRVLDESGVPVVGALVASGSGSARTGPDGAFEVGAPRGRDALVVWAPGFRARSVPAPSAQIGDVELVHLRDVAGRVVFDDGTPVAGTAVLLAEAATVTDTAGRFRFRGIERGDDDVLLSVHPLPGPTVQGAPTEFRSVDVTSDDVTLTVARGARISGRVLRADGTPCVAALVGACEAPVAHDWFRLNTSTDERGRFVLQGVPADAPSRVFVEDHGRVVADLAVAPGGAADVTLVLPE